MAAQLPFESAKFDLLRATPSEFTFSARLGSSQRETVNLPKITISFSPALIQDRDMGTLALESATLHLVERNGILQLPGLLESSSSAPTPLPALPLGLSHILLHNFRLILELESGRSLQFNFDGNADLNFSELADKKKQLSYASLHLSSTGAVNAQMDLSVKSETEGYSITGTIHVQTLEQLASFIEQKTLPELSGKLELELAVQLDQYLQLNDYHINALFPGLQITSGETIIIDSRKSGVANISLTGDQKQARFTIAKLGTVLPKPGELTADGKIDLEKMQAKL